MSWTEFDEEEYEKAITEDAHDRGVAEGIERGIEQGLIAGRTELLIEQVHDGDITIESAAKRLGLSEEEFKKLIK
ncbi:MAG: hypothetical protein MJ105_05640 [Lachnospiraceae bacterium]|nr:hypothetical protein [Lachnospiraceae bacterium]